MVKYDKALLDQIREKSDIVSFLENHGVALRVSGSNIMGLCPFHNERTPSFHVNAGAQRYHCFGCGESGDIFDLVVELEHLTFPGAVQYLADKANIQLPTDDNSDDDSYYQRKRQYEMCRIAANYFRKNFLALPEHHPAKENFAKRKLLEVALDDPTIGYAPTSGLLELLKQKGYKTKEAVDAGLATQYIDQYNGARSDARDKFRNRIMWTICNVQGKPIAFSGRRIYDNEEKSAKYVNSPDTLLYSKRHALLGLSQSKEAILSENSVIIVEGQTDVMAVRASGHMNVVASCGTAFGAEHAQLLLKLAAARKKKAESLKFILCFDGDEAGRGAVEKTFQHIPNIQLQSVVVDWESLNAGKTDPCDYRLAHGSQGLSEALSHQVSLIEFLLKTTLKKYDLSSPEGKSQFVGAIQPILQNVQDKVAHNDYLRRVAFWTGIPFIELQQVIKIPYDKNQNFFNSSGEADNKANAISVHSLDDKLIAAFLQYPQEMSEIFSEEQLQADVFEDQARVEQIIDNVGEYGEQGYKDKLLFYDLKVTVGREKEVLKRLLHTYLRARYISELDQLKSRVSVSDNENSIDTNLLQDMLIEQQQLKTRFKI